MLGRARLQRTVVVVVALLLAAGSTSTLAREFRAADTQNEDYPTVQALRFMGRQVAERELSLDMIGVYKSLGGGWDLDGGQAPSMEEP